MGYEAKKHTRAKNPKATRAKQESKNKKKTQIATDSQK